MAAWASSTNLPAAMEVGEGPPRLALLHQAIHRAVDDGFRRLGAARAVEIDPLPAGIGDRQGGKFGTNTRDIETHREKTCGGS
jgi:hypothetical protein